jgi:SAM-dependent methyltransferase
MNASQHQRIQERFDRESAEWREMYLRSEKSRFAYFDKLYRKRYVLELLGAGRGNALDLGCGAGMFLEDLRRLGYSPLGMDFSAEMVQLASRAEAGRRRVVRADAMALPFGGDSFAAMIAVGLIEYLPEDHATLAEIFRVLKPGGAAVVTLRNARCRERRLWKLYRRFGWRDLGRQGFFREHDRKTFQTLVERQGFTGFAHRYCHFYPVPWPFSAWLPHLNGFLAHYWERWFSRSRLDGMGSTLICRFQKPSGA